jgi:hypothetical protein
MSLLDDVSLLVTPNAEKATKLYSIIPTNGNGDFTVTRATTATRTNASGLIESVPINEPRFDYSLGSCPNILLEPQRTNFVLYSADLSQSVWNKTNYSLSSTTSIQGLNATRITKNAVDNGSFTGTGTRNVVNSIGTYTAGTKTLTYLIRKGNTDKVGFIINNVLVGALTAVSCAFDFNTQTFTNVSSGLTASFESPSANVYRISLTIADAGTATNKAIWIAPINASNSTVDGGYLDFAFAQWETGGYATSYIPTTTASVTRNLDQILRSNVYTNGLITTSGGTWFIDLRGNIPVTRDLSTSGIFLNTGVASTIGNGFVLRNPGVTSSRIEIFTVVAGGLSANLHTIATNNAKVAFKWNGTTADIFVNGVKVIAATPFTPTAMENIIAEGSNRAIQVNSMALFPTPLTDTQCIALTT